MRRSVLVLSMVLAVSLAAERAWAQAPPPTGLQSPPTAHQDSLDETEAENEPIPLSDDEKRWIHRAAIATVLGNPCATGASYALCGLGMLPSFLQGQSSSENEPVMYLQTAACLLGVAGLAVGPPLSSVVAPLGVIIWQSASGRAGDLMRTFLPALPVVALVAGGGALLGAVISTRFFEFGQDMSGFVIMPLGILAGSTIGASLVAIVAVPVLKMTAPAFAPAAPVLDEGPRSDEDREADAERSARTDGAGAGASSSSPLPPMTMRY